MFARHSCFGLVVVVWLGPASLLAAQCAAPASTGPQAAEGRAVPAADAVGDAVPGNAGRGQAELDEPRGGELKPDVRRSWPRVGTRHERETALALALEWFARHQLDGGSWSFDHTQAPFCGGKCGNPGNLQDARNAATAMALLAFLGSGHTHTSKGRRADKYEQTLRRGLDYLVENMKQTEHGGVLSERGGTMYSHALATMALARAYGMTQDPDLLQPAQAAVNYICYAQDPVGGGWRYAPRQKGDTSVTGWQVMALKCGHMAYLRVPIEVVKKVPTFLDSVQANDGATYGYTGPGEGRGTTAVGLWCRMTLGCYRRDNPALQRGVERISDWGVSTEGNMSYNYYAAQVMYLWGGEAWEKWYDQMHDWLVNSQVKQGHAAGSWFFGRGDHGADRGGRHYTTAMAAMMLQVVYQRRPRDPEELDFKL